jgi:hypothetical protein
VGNYNLFWTDRGMHVLQIDGEYRTSMIIEPPNGRIPSRRSEAEFYAARTREANDGPEGRAPGERCLLAFGSASGPPMLPVMYNSYYQIVQSPGYVMILVEMVHDARIIRVGDKHHPANMQKWMGDSIGRWEGDTLVVETTNFAPLVTLRGSDEHLRVVERFTPDGRDALRYQFTIDDPTAFTAGWTGAYTMTRTTDRIYEYACHEGNFGLLNILSQARSVERR